MAAPNRETVLTYGALYGDAAFDTLGGDATPAYQIFTPDNANNTPAADLRARAGQNAPGTLGFLFCDTSNRVHLLHNLYNVAQAIGPNASQQAGLTVAMVNEIRQVSGPSWVQVTDHLFHRVQATQAPTLAHLDALIGAAGDAADLLVPEGAAGDALSRQIS